MSADLGTKLTEVLYVLVPTAVMLLTIIAVAKVKAKKVPVQKSRA